MDTYYRMKIGISFPSFVLSFYLFFPHLSAGLAQMTMAWPLIPSLKFEPFFFFFFTLPMHHLALHMQVII